MSMRVTEEEAQIFRWNCRAILDEVNMPASWLARLLGYSRSSGLSMAMKEGGTQPSREAFEASKQLIQGLVAHQRKAGASLQGASHA